MKFFDLTKEADLIIKKNILRDLEIFLKKGSYINGKENLLLENKFNLIYVLFKTLQIQKKLI